MALLRLAEHLVEAGEVGVRIGRDEDPDRHGGNAENGSERPQRVTAMHDREQEQDGNERDCRELSGERNPERDSCKYRPAGMERNHGKEEREGTEHVGSDVAAVRDQIGIEYEERQGDERGGAIEVPVRPGDEHEAKRKRQRDSDAAAGK